MDNAPKISRHKPLGDFGIRVNPLPLDSAAMLYALVFISSSLLWANIPLESRARLFDYWGLAFIILLPLSLIVFRMLTNFLASAWFAIGAIAAILVVSAVAATVMPVDEAMRTVFRTFPFAALGASLGASLAACILRRRWTRANLPYLALHAGLLLTVAGGFTTLVARVDGFISLPVGQSAAGFSMRDHVLEIETPAGDLRRVPLGSPARRQTARRVALDNVSIEAVRSGPRGEGAVLMLFAQDEARSDTATLHYGGPAAELELSAGRYRAAFGPTRAALPFAIYLVAATAEYYPASNLPRSYLAEVSIIDGADGAADAADFAEAPRRTISVNSPLRHGGFDIYLMSMDESRGAVLEVVRDPGAALLFAGGLIFVAGLSANLARRLGLTGRPGAQCAAGRGAGESIVAGLDAAGDETADEIDLPRDAPAEGEVDGEGNPGNAQGDENIDR